ncbi:MAG: exo-alpha-sialidase [Caldilinea sp. CFX5]|nr:exo-alpha-sialidase [Caldilinea sp. CFX5]
MSYPLRPLFVVALLLGLLVLPYTLWGQTDVDAPNNRLFLPIAANAGGEQTQHSDTSAADLENVAAPTEFFPDEPDVALEPDDLVQDLVQSSAVSAFTVNTIDGTEDYRALGYPDARKIVRDSGGRLYVAYRKKVDGAYRIFVAQSSNSGATWQVLNSGAPVETVGKYNQRVPALAIDNQDRLHLVWYGNDAGNTNATNNSNEREIKYTRSIATSTGLQWEPWRNLYDGAAYTTTKTLWQEHPALYVNGTNIYAVWESNETPRAHIKFQRSTDYGVTWRSSPVLVRPSSTVGFSRPTLLVSYYREIRYLYLFAYGSQNGIAQIYWSRSSDNGDTWLAWQTVAASSTDQRHVSVARDTKERLHLVWRQVYSGRTILRYRVYDPALNSGRGGWVASPATIASVSQRCLYYPSIAINSSDQVWIVWTQSADCGSLGNPNDGADDGADNPKDGQIFLRTRSANSSWRSPTAVTTSGKHLYASLRRVNNPAGAGGNVDVVWLDMTNSTLSVAGTVVCPAQACVMRQSSLGGW